MNTRLTLVATVVATLLVSSVAPAQNFKPAPSPRSTVRPTPPPTIIVLPPCDPSKLIDLLDEYYAPVPFPTPAPEYCAVRTCESKALAIKHTKDWQLHQSIDLMRQACRTYFP